MVRIQVDLEKDREINWLVLSGRQRVPKGVIKDGTGHGGEAAEAGGEVDVLGHAEDDKIAAAAKGRSKDIYGNIIAKWTNISQGKGFPVVRDPTPCEACLGQSTLSPEYSSHLPIPQVHGACLYPLGKGSKQLACLLSWPAAKTIACKRIAPHGLSSSRAQHQGAARHGL